MKILVALSGGVDSFMSAKILKDLGHNIKGVYMKLFDNKEYHLKNISNIKEISRILDIDFEVLDLKNDFLKDVKSYFINSYSLGLTPNPCMMCNKFIKVKKLLEFKNKIGFDKLATGHYAIIKDDRLKKGADLSKDQSYFLSFVQRDNFKDLIFPLGEFKKADIKKEASKYFQKIATQKESSEVCFIPNSYIDILKDHFNTDIKGSVKNLRGEIIGTHKGYMHYTIGQRKGFDVPLALEPHFVYKIDANKNELVVVKKDEAKNRNLILTNINYFYSQDEIKNKNKFIKIRYRSKEIPCEIEFLKDELKIYLQSEINFISPGQFGVIYDEFGYVLASGVIK